MRGAYLETLDRLTQSLVEMTGLVSDAMGSATAALLEADLGRAERVIAGDDAVDAIYFQVENLVLEVLATQSPVAGDLRQVVTTLRVVSELERMGDLAHHIASMTRRHFPNPVIPEPLRPLIRQMGEAATRLHDKVAVVIAERDLDVAREIVRDDDALDELQQRLYAELRRGAAAGPGEAIDLALLGRFYERFGDHAVKIARRMVFLVTGEQPEPGS